VANDFGEIKTYLQSYLAGRTDLDAMLPLFVQTGQAKLEETLATADFVELQALYSASVSKGDTTFALPPRFLHEAFLWLEYSDGSKLKLVKAPKDAMALEWTPTSPGVPSGYVIFGGLGYFIPELDENVVLMMQFFQRQPTLSVDSDSNIFTAPPYNHLLIYSALLETEPFLQNDERIKVWGGLLQDGLDKIVLRSQRAENSGNLAEVQ